MDYRGYMHLRPPSDIFEVAIPSKSPLLAEAVDVSGMANVYLPQI